MVPGLDSSFTPPSAAMADAAKAAGHSVWSGYLATRSNVGLAHPWTRGDFENARRCGGTPIAYASGWDDPVACQRLARDWNVRLCLDVESGIRADGTWVQDWLNLSGAGLYGNAPVFAGRRAAFYILAAYPGADPKATWPPKQPRPNGPCGWQWQGSTGAFGATVDRTWLDDWFGASINPPQPKETPEMLIVVSSAGAWLLSGSMYVHLVAPSDVPQGIPQWHVDDAQHAALVAASESFAQPQQPTAAIGGTLALSGTLKVGP